MSAFFIFKQRKKQYYFKTILKEKICKKNRSNCLIINTYDNYFRFTSL